MSVSAAASIGGPVLIRIAKKLIKKGSSKLAEKLLKGSGPVAERVAGDIVEGVAEHYGVKAVDVETIDAPTLPEVVDHVIDERSSDWVAFARAINDTMIAEHSASNLLSRIWRPIFGLAFTFVYTLLGVSFAYGIFFDPAPLTALISISGLLMAFVGAGAAVLGVYVYGRTAEKKEGAA